MRSPSLDFALRASLRLSKYAPGEFVFGGAKKSISPEGRNQQYNMYSNA